VVQSGLTSLKYTVTAVGSTVSDSASTTFTVYIYNPAFSAPLTASGDLVTFSGSILNPIGTGCGMSSTEAGLASSPTCSASSADVAVSFVVSSVAECMRSRSGIGQYRDNQALVALTMKLKRALIQVTFALVMILHHSEFFWSPHNLWVLDYGL